MSKTKNHYHEELEALTNAQMADYEGEEKESKDNVLDFKPLPEEAIQVLANDLKDLEGDDFWTKMQEIEEYYETHYMAVA